MLTRLSYFLCIFVVIGLFLTRYAFYDAILVTLYKPTAREFVGKYVVVTGASMGIGRATAESFCKRGANLIITARSQSKLEEVKQKCSSQYGNADVHYVTGDMSINEDILKVAKFITKVHSSGIDHLVLNHIIPYRVGYFDGDMDFVRTSFQLNYLSYIDLTQYLLAQLNKRSGQILVISSLAAKFPFPLVPVYSSTKHALDGFYGALRSEFDNHGANIKISLVHFGPVTTESVLKTMQEMSKEKINKQNLPPFLFLSESESADAVLSAALAQPYDLYQASLFRLVDLFLPFCENSLYEYSFILWMKSDAKYETTWNTEVYGD